MDFGSFKLTWSLTPMSLTKTVPLSYNSGKSSVKFFHWFSLSYSRFSQWVGSDIWIGQAGIGAHSS